MPGHTGPLPNPHLCRLSTRVLCGARTRSRVRRHAAREPPALRARAARAPARPRARAIERRGLASAPERAAAARPARRRATRPAAAAARPPAPTPRAGCSRPRARAARTRRSRSARRRAGRGGACGRRLRGLRACVCVALGARVRGGSARFRGKIGIAFLTTGNRSLSRVEKSLSRLTSHRPTSDGIFASERDQNARANIQRFTARAHAIRALARSRV